MPRYLCAANVRSLGAVLAAGAIFAVCAGFPASTLAADRMVLCEEFTNKW
ncbi:MAG: hypothetical protein JSV78_05385 [Phycisphaerales bacterium]|nr:MAG: hypothetical protein JSV78_05385 [Phycisphaerales bacterium]